MTLHRYKVEGGVFKMILNMFEALCRGVGVRALTGLVYACPYEGCVRICMTKARADGVWLLLLLAD